MKQWHPSEEEFAAWRDDPVTKWVMSACEKAADQNKAAWTESAWASGKADQAGLTECRTLADAYMALTQTTYDGWIETHEGGQ